MRCVWILLLGAVCQFGRAAERKVTFLDQEDRIIIQLDGTAVASYVFRDDDVPRPYFAHVQTPSGLEVTRRHPPKAPDDAIDHAGLHTGIWLSFGDLSGFDYWRLKARTAHVEFTQRPAAKNGRGSFAVRNRYLNLAGDTAICEEVCRYEVHVFDSGYLIKISSQLTPMGGEIVFGDQEEMGLGVRVASPLAVDRKLGGRMLDSEGRRNGDQIWGKTASWCDYSGSVAGKWVGLTVMAAPDNFRPCWMHARDYGFVALNPFGRRAFTGGEPSRIVVRPGESMSLGFGIFVHESEKEADYDIKAAYRHFVEGSANPKSGS